MISKLSVAVAALLVVVFATAASLTSTPAEAALKCAQNYQLIGVKCVLKQNCGRNAYRSPEGDCYCKTGYEKRGAQCVRTGSATKTTVKTNKAGFEIAPWKKPGCTGWKRQCDRGDAKACTRYESTCQVN